MKWFRILLLLLICSPAFAEDKLGNTYGGVPPPAASGQILGTNGTLPEWETVAGGSGNCTFTRNGAGSYTLNCPNYANASLAGTAPQFYGFTTTGTAEAETMAGDATMTRTTTGTYTIAVGALHFGPTHQVTLYNQLPQTGGIPYMYSPTSMWISPTLNMNQPVFGGGTYAAPFSGTVSGNTTEVASVTGTLTVGDCVKIDANYNFIDAGAACGTGSGGGGFTAGGDLSGTSTSQTVVGLQTKPLPAPTTGYLWYSGTALSWQASSGMPFAPLNNPTGGQNNYAPIASPTLTGTTTTPVLALTNETISSLTWPHSSITSTGTSSVPSLAIQAGGYYNGTNWIATSTQVLGMSMYANGITFGYAGASVGNSYTISTMATISGSGINIPAGENYYSNGTAIGGTCTSGQYISAFSGAGVITCGTPAGGTGGISEAPTDGNAYMRASSAWSSGGTLVNPLTTPTLNLTNESTSSLKWPHGSIMNVGSSTVPDLEIYGGGYYNGTQYISTSTSILGIELYANSITLGYANVATAGNAFSLTSMAQVSASGINLPTGENYYINSVALFPVPITEGGTGNTAAAASGYILVGQSATAFAPKAVAGDATLAAGGGLTVTKTNGTAFTALATAAVPLSIANGGRGSTTAPTTGQIDVASSATAFTPVTMSGAATITSAGVVSLTTPVPLTGTTATIGFDFAGPVAAGAIASFTCVVPMTIPANFASPNSVLTCGTNPAESDAYTVKVNGATVGTLTISTACVITRGSSSSTTCSAGQRMEIDAPATVSGNDVAISLGVTR